MKHARRLLAGHADLVHVVVAEHVVVGVGAACRVNRIAQSEERDGRVALQPCTRCAAVCRGGSNTCFRQLALVFTCNCAPSVRVQSVLRSGLSGLIGRWRHSVAAVKKEAAHTRTHGVDELTLCHE